MVNEAKLLARVKEILSIKSTEWASKPKEEWKVLFNTYFHVFGVRKDITCGTCVIEAYFELKESLNQNKIMDVSNAAFRLKKDSQICLSSGQIIMNANLTDEIALGLLKRSKGYLKQFEKFPDDWEAQVDKLKEKNNILEKEIATAGATANEEVKEETPEEKFEKIAKHISNQGQKKLRLWAHQNKEAYDLNEGEFMKLENKELKTYLVEMVAKKFETLYPAKEEILEEKKSTEVTE